MCRQHTTWDDICDFVAQDILGYQSTRLQRISYQKLQGVKKGQVVANNKAKINSSYTDEDLLQTLKLCKGIILRGIKNKNIQGELGKVSYTCAVCRSYIDGVSKRRKNIVAAKEKMKEMQTDQLESESAKYVPKSTENVNLSGLESLW